MQEQGNVYHIVIVSNRITLVSSLSVETSIRVVLYIPAVKAYRFRR